ncbi:MULTISPECIES: fibronectin type III domain-containing protein [unclassified Bacteroides]|uniref:fibronectin type III domain-containing protein n=1 Tax=unclassified Bacteroides TaxID=2646097 RepID=UPI0040636D43
MRTIYRIALLAMMWMWVIPTVNAQENLLKNGDFEGAWSGSGYSMNPEGWTIATQTTGTMSVNEKRDGGNGTKVFMAYLSNGGSISQNDIKVKNGESYKLTLWHKMKDDSNKKFHIRFNCYDSESNWLPDAKVEEVNFTIKQRDKWMQETFVIKIPANTKISTMSMSISFPYSSRGGEVYLDDISLIKSESGSTTPEIQKPEKPQQVKVVAFQREITVSWKKSKTEGITYEVKNGEQEFTKITGTSFTLEKLEPGKSYTIEVCAVKDGVKSEYVRKNAITDKLEKAADSEDRIPYLRTLEPAGSCKGRFLKLYYNDLANPNANISYKLDGKTVEPINNTLEFPAFDGNYKRFQLEIHIDEGNGREWEILYNELTVQNF